MFDLTKLLNEDNNLSNLSLVNPSLVSLSTNVQPMLIPRRSMNSHEMQLDMDETFSAPQTTPSSSLGAFGANSSYGASPQQTQATSPGYSGWGEAGLASGYGMVTVKQELEPAQAGPGHIGGPGLAMSGGTMSLSSGPGSAEYLSHQNAGPTLAQLNSPPNDDLTVLRTFGDLDSLNLDLDALTGDLLGQYPVEIKTEYVPVVQGSVPSFSWGRASNLSTSVPTPVISHVSDFQELSNLSSGGPAVSPNRLTLSPPARSTLSPVSASVRSPPQGAHLTVISPVSPGQHANIPSTVPVAPAVSPPSALHSLLMRKGPEVPDPIRSRSNSNQFKSAKRPIVNRQRNSLSLSNPLLVSQLSKSAPVKNPTLDMIWNRREPRPHMNSMCSNAGESSIADEVSEVLNSLSPSELNDIDSEDEDNTNNEADTDDDLRIGEEDLAGLGGSGSGRKERFFWQYNVQAKGPKGQKLALDTKIHDPHQLNEVIDPVFSDNVQVHGIKHRYMFT